MIDSDRDYQDRDYSDYDSDSDEDSGENLGQVRVLRATAKAILVSCKGKELWVPKSVVHDDSEVFDYPQEPGELIVKSWWADKNGLI